MSTLLSSIIRKSGLWRSAVDYSGTFKEVKANVAVYYTLRKK